MVTWIVATMLDISRFFDGPATLRREFHFDAEALREVLEDHDQFLGVHEPGRGVGNSRNVFGFIDVPKGERLGGKAKASRYRLRWLPVTDHSLAEERRLHWRWRACQPA